ncbi:hypothetical protein Plhal304r1_c036g0110731 [Plasmopara halstedii]
MSLSRYSKIIKALLRWPRTEFFKRTKHTDNRFHFAREMVRDGRVNPKYCHTQDMLADMMTKPIVSPQLEFLCTKLGIRGVAAVESSGSVVSKHLEQLSRVQDTTYIAPRLATTYRYVAVSAFS